MTMQSKPCGCDKGCGLVIRRDSRAIGRWPRCAPGCPHAEAIKDELKRSWYEKHKRKRARPERVCMKCRKPLTIDRQGRRLHPECRSEATKAKDKWILSLSQPDDGMRGHVENVRGSKCKACWELAHRRPLTGCPRCKEPHVPLPELRLVDFATLHSSAGMNIDGQ